MAYLATLYSASGALADLVYMRRLDTSGLPSRALPLALAKRMVRGTYTRPVRSALTLDVAYPRNLTPLFRLAYRLQ